MYMRSMMALFFGCMLCAVADDDPARAILVLRDRQHYASYNDYREYEKEIQRIKNEQGGVYHTDPWFTWHTYVHAVPWLVWQIAVIILAVLLAVLIPYAWHGQYRGVLVVVTSVLILTTYIVWSGYTQAQHVRAVVVCNQVPVYLGPGKDYPTRGSLTYLDEVTVLQRLEDWIKVRYTDTSGWIYADNIVDGSS